MFVAIFFVSVGMLIDPSIILKHLPEVAIFTVVVILGKVSGVTLGAFFTGNGIRTSVRTGMSLAQIGEFSFIIAGLGIALNATGDFLYTIAVAVSALTILTTPWLIKAGDPAARFIDRKLPRPLQTFAALYGSWIENMRTAPQDKTTGRVVRRLVKLLLLDSVLLTVIVIGAAVSMDAISSVVIIKLGLSNVVARLMIILIVLGLALPFIIGVIRIAQGLGLALASLALPEAGMGKVDLADAPRRAFVVMLQLAIVLVVGLPLLALTQPFLPRWIAASTLGVLLIFLGIMLWRNATNLQGHIRAGAELVVEALAKQSHKRSSMSGEMPLMEIKHLLPGLGEPVPLRLDEHSFAVGKTLSQLNVRGLTGASVLAIVRGEENVIMPSASEHLRVDDILALVGTREAVNAATVLLKDGQLEIP
jgi:CPA2 family monovalent cation:H+ antiporter-2